MKFPSKKVRALLCALLVSSPVMAKDSFKMCWSIYAGWMPWSYAKDAGIMDKWADKYNIDIEIVQINDYVESMNQYTAGQFDACTMAQMDALTIPAAGGVDSTVLIAGDYSNGNDSIILRGNDQLEDIEGQEISLVEYSISHYLLARGLETVGMSERDVHVINTSDADLVSVFASGSSTATVTWNPLANEILSMPDTHDVFNSSKIPGEIIDALVVNTETLKKNPALGKALTGAWYEVMSVMSAGTKAGEEARSMMADAAQTTLAGYNAQLEKTYMYYTPESALELVNSPELLKTMKHVAEFSFNHGLLGEMAPSADIVGIEMPAGVYGNPANIKLRFDNSFMQMAADGKL